MRWACWLPIVINFLGWIYSITGKFLVQILRTTSTYITRRIRFVSCSTVWSNFVTTTPWLIYTTTLRITSPNWLLCFLTWAHSSLTRGGSSFWVWFLWIFYHEVISLNKLLMLRSDLTTIFCTAWIFVCINIAFMGCNLKISLLRIVAINRMLFGFLSRRISWNCASITWNCI